MKTKLAFILLLTLFLSAVLAININHAGADDTLQGWQRLDDGTTGHVSVSNGTIRFWTAESNGFGFDGASFWTPFSPQTDFQVTLQVKAMRLGAAGPDSNLEGFAILLRPNASLFGTPTGVNFEMRGAYGGMFLLARYTNMWSWEPPFVGGEYYVPYNPYFPFGYPPASAPTSGPTFPIPSTFNASGDVQTGVWYTMKLSVQKTPFVVTAQVFDENGTLMGTRSVSDMTNFKFGDIKYISIGAGWGGDFYVKNITGLPPGSLFTFSPTQPATQKGTIFDASNSTSVQGPIANYSWGFGDGTTNSTNQSVVQHVYQQPAVYNVTLTTFGADGLNSSSTQTINVLASSYLSLSSDVESSAVSSPIAISGRLSDYDRNGLADRLVLLWYTFAGANSSIPISSTTTDQAGNYTFQWVNLATGTFTLGAQWSGDSLFASTSSAISFISVPYENQNVFYLQSNSTITELAFNSTSSELGFTVSGPSGTKGYTEVTIAKSLMSNAQNLKVYLDGKELNYSLAESKSTWALTFFYSHSIHKLDVILPSVNLDLSTSNQNFPTNNETNQLPSPFETSPNYLVLFAALAIVCLAVVISGIVILRRNKHKTGNATK